MNKYNFIITLQKALTGKVTTIKLKEITDYYTNYIDSEIWKGKNEKEVLDNLGDPRLLAKTIIATEGSENTKAIHRNIAENEKKSKGIHFRIPSFVVWLVGIIVFLFVISLFMGFIGLIIRFAIPVIIPFVLVIMAVRWVNKRQ